MLTASGPVYTMLSQARQVRVGRHEVSSLQYSVSSSLQSCNECLLLSFALTASGSATNPHAAPSEPDFGGGRPRSHHHGHFYPNSISSSRYRPCPLLSLSRLASTKLTDCLPTHFLLACLLVTAAALSGPELDTDTNVLLARTVDRVVKLARPHSEVFEVEYACMHVHIHTQSITHAFTRLLGI